MNCTISLGMKFTIELSLLLCFKSRKYKFFLFLSNKNPQVLKFDTQVIHNLYIKAIIHGVSEQIIHLNVFWIALKL